MVIPNSVHASVFFMHLLRKLGNSLFDSLFRDELIQALRCPVVAVIIAIVIGGIGLSAATYPMPEINFL